MTKSQYQTETIQRQRQINVTSKKDEFWSEWDRAD